MTTVKDLPYTPLAGKPTSTLDKTAKALLCGRVLKPYADTTDTYELANFCRQYHLCYACDKHRSRDFSRKRSQHTRGITGLRCFDLVIHFDPFTTLDQSRLALDQAGRIRKRLAKSLRNSWLDSHIVDYVLGTHLKLTPHSSVTQPHIHGAILTTRDVSARDMQAWFESWKRSHSRNYVDPTISADSIDLDPRTSILRYRGIVVSSINTNRPNTQKVIEAIKVRNLLAYTIRTTEKDGTLEDRVTSHSLLTDANVHSFSARKLGTGKSSGPCRFGSDLPLIVIPFDDRPRLVHPNYRKNVELSLKSDALNLIDRVASGKGFNPFKIPSTLCESDLFPEDMYPEDAHAIIRASWL